VTAAPKDRSGRTALRVRGTGSALPTRVVTNAEIEALTGLCAGKIKRLFDIDQRHWSRGLDSAAPAKDQRCSALAAQAATRALADAGVEGSEIDAVVVASITPDFVNPPLDYCLAEKLGLRDILGFSIQAPCTGLFRALVLADALIASGRASTILVVAAETISPFFALNPNAPEDHLLSAALYADAAGAMVVDGQEGEGGCITFVDTRTTGREEQPGILFPGTMSANPPGSSAMSLLGYHDFGRVLERGGELAADALKEGIRQSGWSLDEVDLLLTHQATGNMHTIGDRYGLPAEKIPINIGKRGNTISASILLLLDELRTEGRVTAGTRIVAGTAESSSWSQGALALHWR
jgi:3-oxoacyl-[acyl-carrier-protein] synthase-3